MGGHGSSKHLKRPASGKFAGLHRKGSVWIEKPLPGPHSKKACIPLSTLVRDLLKLADSSSQSGKLVRSGKILVDGRRVSKVKLPVGLMDLISIPDNQQNYLVGVHKGVLKLYSVKDVSVKHCKVVGKKIAGKDKIQLALHDGRVVLTSDKGIKVGDTLKLAVPKQEVKGVLKLDKGALCLVYLGRHSGEVGVLQEVIALEGSRHKDARLKVGDSELVTRKDYLFVIETGLFD
ncbi:MAG: S4 domain-containing protein [Candidatus Micrarchaeota archaeon]